MTVKQELLAEIEAYLVRTGMPPTTFGVRALNDGGFVRRLRDGADVRTETIDKIRAFMASDKRVRAGNASSVAA